MLIGVDVDLTYDEESNEAAYTLNHEEFHAESALDGNEGVEKEGKDHGKYYGENKKNSPDDEEVKTDPKYANSEALKQYKEIDKIVEKNEKK